GNMGLGMARNLMSAGFDVLGTNRGPAPRAALAGLGGRVAASAAAIGAEAGIVFVMVVDAAQTRDVLVGQGGLLETMKPGGIVVVTATIGRAAMQALDAPLRARGIALIDCPVSGGRQGAEAGTLTLMAAGDPAAFARCRAVFAAIASNVTHVGEEAGMGQVVKACMQGLVGCIYGGIFEALVLGVKAGVPAETLHAVIGTSVANTPLFQSAVPAILQRRFAGTGSSIGNTTKDLTLTLALSAETGATMPITAAAQQFFQAGNTKFPGEDNQCLIKLLEDVAGVQVRARATPPRRTGSSSRGTAGGSARRAARTPRAGH
ncbi:MAG: NAD(P)-dependent oxidoreductase, partial [Rhodospirillales bacterium]|nr:NAD(P)-dependent oxidoreductase [Rhodospirillales bacterium]